LIQKIAVLGTGANGSCAAADLTRKGFEVDLLDQWPEHVEAMRRDGLKIFMPDEKIEVAVSAHHLCDLAYMSPKYDLVLLYTKAYDTRWSCELIKPYLHEDGLLVGMQNAMTVNDIVEIVGAERSVGVVVECSSEIFTPGIVQRNTPPKKTWFGVGGLEGSREGSVEEVAEILSNVGNVSISSDIMSAKWIKLVINTTMAVVATLGLNGVEALRANGMREVLMRVTTEALNVSQGMGNKLVPIFGLNEEDIKDSNRFLETLFEKMMADVGPAARDCILQDHLKGRRSEAQDINGLVVENGIKLGLSTEVNSTIVEISKRIHSGELSPGPETFELVKEMISS
jgi:2-dehydropantoate 2-reductase